MSEQFQRTEKLIGEARMERLFAARVAVFGLGGVGGYAVEALARSGIGTLDLIDPDKVEVSNLNRQILATWETIGRYKADVAAERIRSINPEAVVNVHRIFFLPDTKDQFDFSAFDYVVDAIDTVTGKIALAQCAAQAGTPIISCMGAGDKMDASALEVADLYETSVCPMARVMRRELKKRGIESLKVVYSREPALRPEEIEGEKAPADTDETASGKTAWKKQTPGSNAFVPGAAGLIMAGEVVRDLTTGYDGGES